MGLFPLAGAPVPTVHKAGWAAELVWTGVKKRKSLAATRVRTPNLQPVTSRNTDYTTMVHFSCTKLLFISIKYWISYGWTKRNIQILHITKFQLQSPGALCNKSLSQIHCKFQLNPKHMFQNAHGIVCRELLDWHTFFQIRQIEYILTQ